MHHDYTSVEIHKIIQNLYAPKDVVNNSEMVGEAFEYLIALNNKGYNAHEIKLSDKVSMQTLDKAIRYKDLYYLEILIENNELTYSFWKYPRKTRGETLHTSIIPFKKRHSKYINNIHTLCRLINCNLKDPH